ncbi:hypothetical protein TNCV_3403921 [Trichonephila clavipes]|nr:hypothetical protein TNCV_3403921 [Trichonephila clavipes]
MKFSEGRKSFEMCKNCSEPATSAHILKCLGLTKQNLADLALAGVGLSETVRCHGPGLALLTNGGVQQQQQQHKSSTGSLPQLLMAVPLLVRLYRGTQTKLFDLLC